MCMIITLATIIKNLPRAPLTKQVQLEMIHLQFNCQRSAKAADIIIKMHPILWQSEASLGHSNSRCPAQRAPQPGTLTHPKGVFSQSGHRGSQVPGPSCCLNPRSSQNSTFASTACAATCCFLTCKPTRETIKRKKCIIIYMHPDSSPQILKMQMWLPHFYEHALLCLTHYCTGMHACVRVHA